MADMTISQLYGTKAPKAWESVKALPLDNPSTTLLYGVELEIENCYEEWNTAGFKVVTDGSLRNSGLEFISSPMTYTNLVYALNMFFNKNKPREVKDDHNNYMENSNYSDRTSIHVHTNVNDLTLKQLMALCLIYEVFEKLLFSYIGNDRDKNIFCVPWSETVLSYAALPGLISQDNLGVIKKWQKYTALNLLPILTQGSIEWRHMYGNSNTDFIFTWLRLIGHMYKYVKEKELDEIKNNFINLNTTSAYDAMMNSVFEYDADRLRSPNYRALLEDGVLEMKYSMLEKPVISKKPTKIQFDTAPGWNEAEALHALINAGQAGQLAVGVDRINNVENRNNFVVVDDIYREPTMPPEPAEPNLPRQVFRPIPRARNNI